MKIDGRKIALELEKPLKADINKLNDQGITPHLAVILVGKDKSSINYVRQKLKIGRKLKIKIRLYRYNLTLTPEVLINLVNSLNKDKKVHGIIVQRPVTIQIPSDAINNAVYPEKDVDGFHPDSCFDPPVALAVNEILRFIYKVKLSGKNKTETADYSGWLKKKKILLIGRGETAGKPIAKYFNKIGIRFTIAHSQSRNIKKLSRISDIVIPCVGKPNIVRHDMLKKSAAIIGVGLHPENDKLKPDYNQAEMEKSAGFYTPVPGGVGPVNVVMLMRNTVLAAKKTVNFDF
ncbi:hypothetical protein A3D05_04275 [Candidatus Gottesmanbacteria bacterium RIFCSPHIGHO2_02_FULL_40_24]|nr:MAG: hypothetical protein A3D05_04275 [Candidatus Gottesmanbacteria bacterium RIFCSPHIGHO2_02_FULL_40_24]